MRRASRMVHRRAFHRLHLGPLTVGCGGVASSSLVRGAVIQGRSGSQASSEGTPLACCCGAGVRIVARRLSLNDDALFAGVAGEGGSHASWVGDGA